MPSSTGAGVDSFDLSASFGFDFAFANDLKMSLVALSFFAPDFESCFLRVVGSADGWGVERPDALSSEALPLRAGAGASFSFAPVVAAGFTVGFGAGFGTGFAVDFDVAAPVGRAYFAVLLYGKLACPFV